MCCVVSLFIANGNRKKKPRKKTITKVFAKQNVHSLDLQVQSTRYTQN